MRIDFADGTLQKRIKYYGQRTQLDVRQEERAEFIQQCSKIKRGKGVKNHVLEEVADLFIVAKQVMMMVGITESDLQNEVIEKCKRLQINMELEGAYGYDGEDNDGDDLDDLESSDDFDELDDEFLD